MGWVPGVGCMLSESGVKFGRLVEMRFGGRGSGRCRIWELRKYERFGWMSCRFGAAMRWRRWGVLA